MVYLDSDGFDKEKVKIFFRYLVRAAERHEKRKTARKKLDEHVEKIKKSKSKRELGRRLSELGDKVDDVVMAEKGVPKRKISDEETKERINELEKHFREYVKAKEDREERVKELEKRFKRKAKDKSFIALRKRIMLLERKYFELMNKGYSSEELKNIKDRIDSLKERL